VNRIKLKSKHRLLQVFYFYSIFAQIRGDMLVKICLKHMHPPCSFNCQLVFLNALLRFINNSQSENKEIHDCLWKRIGYLV